MHIVCGILVAKTTRLEICAWIFTRLNRISSIQENQGFLWLIDRNRTFDKQWQVILWSISSEVLPTLVGAYDGGLKIKPHESAFLYPSFLYPHNYLHIFFCSFKQITLTNQPVRLECVCVPTRVIVSSFPRREGGHVLLCWSVLSNWWYDCF